MLTQQTRVDDLNQHHKNRQFPASNPLANLLVIVVGALTIAISVVVGVVAFFALMGVVLCFAAILGVRAWWINRRIRSGRQQNDPQHGGGAHVSQTIEGEFRVVEADNKNTPKH
jgi:membrane protein implicated in regulation of membrane protease activity